MTPLMAQIGDGFVLEGDFDVATVMPTEAGLEALEKYLATNPVPAKRPA